ncbi:LysR substrate-binding domain-containing protein [Streptomyces sp. NPDC048349]|uniref:LysR substrate-binding domain-containing protein n=1 Tax=Streptomyces sp. NPDC048349 TaxID=3155486 RepID=UPI00341D7CAE
MVHIDPVHHWISQHASGPGGAWAVDVLLAPFPVREPDLRCRPVLIREEQVPAVPAGHVLARRASVTQEALADVPVLRTAPRPQCPITGTASWCRR